MKWLLLVLIIITVIILIPPLHYGYIYPTQGDDTATHIIYFKNMDEPVVSYYIGGDPIPVYPLYWGQYIFGKLFNRLPFDINTSFLWFHFIVLILSVWAIGLSVGFAVNPLAGIFAAILVFGRSFLLTLFYWGTIFDIVGVAVLLPLLLLFLHRKSFIGIMLLSPLFAIFHDNGQMIYGLIVAVLGAEIVERKFSKYVRFIEENRILIYCSVLFGGLTFLFLIKFGIDYSRMWSEATIILAIILAIIAGKLLVNEKKTLILAVIFMAIVISVPNVKIWLENHSAIKGVDKQVIEYVNDLPGDTYIVSPEVTVNIYRLYVTKHLARSSNNADYIITRSEAMTETSAIAVKHQDGTFTVDGYKMLREFEDDGIQMAVYAK